MRPAPWTSLPPGWKWFVWGIGVFLVGLPLAGGLSSLGRIPTPSELVGILFPALFPLLAYGILLLCRRSLGEILLVLTMVGGIHFLAAGSVCKVLPLSRSCRQSLERGFEGFVERGVWSPPGLCRAQARARKGAPAPAGGDYVMNPAFEGKAWQEPGTAAESEIPLAWEAAASDHRAVREWFSPPRPTRCVLFLGGVVREMPEAEFQERMGRP